MEKSKSEVERNFQKSEERKTIIKDKIKLNYDPNYKLMIHDERLEGKHVF